VWRNTGICSGERGQAGSSFEQAEGAVDGTRFGHAHFGVVEDHGRYIAGMGVAKADPARALRCFVNGGLEDPAVFLRTTQSKRWLNVNSSAAVPLCKPEQFGMSDVRLCAKHLMASSGLVGATRVVAAHHTDSPQIVMLLITIDNYCCPMINN
jgi:hypothetical protein